MFDQETAQFFQMLRSNTIGDSTSIGLRSVLESNIPSNVKTFFRADVEWLRAREKAREVRSSKFSFSIPEVRLLDEQIDLLLVNNYTFTRKDFEATADKCIHFLLNYLCRPQWTLSSFFFDDTIRITSEEMLAKLRYCADYPYYRAVLAKYADARQRTDVGSEEMKRLLRTIDDEVCANASPKELAAIARPIFEFLGTIRASMKPPLPASVPVRALIYFFEDKRLTKYADALTAIRDMDNGIELTPSMLEMALEAASVSSVVPDIAALRAAGERETEPTVEPPADTEPTAEPPAVMEPTVQPPADTEPAVEPPADTEPAVDPPAETEPADDDSRLMELKVDGPFEVAPPYFSEADRQTIVSTLFNGDEAMFGEAISEAANTRTWDEAIITLDRFFAEHGIDPFSKEAMMFANILESWHRTLSGTESAD